MIGSRLPFRTAWTLAVIASLLGGALISGSAEASKNAAIEHPSLASIPPYSGTAFLDPDIITSSDPSTFVSYAYKGRGWRTMYDRRVNAFVKLYAYLFKATYSDGSVIEVQVNPEFGSSAAAEPYVQEYAWLVGQLPAVLRKDVKKLWIHQGNEDFGGGNNSIMIYVDRAVSYGDYIEEILLHESAHTSLDAVHAASTGWLAAQAADGEFISTYASDNPTREDVAESFLTYIAIRYKSTRISASDANTIQTTIPNRIAYFDSQAFNLAPIATTVRYKSQGIKDGWILESDSASNTGGALNSNASTLRLGDDAANRQYRSILSFDTSTLPDTAVITRLSLRFKKTSTTTGGDPVSLLQGFMVDIKNGTFDNAWLEPGDFIAAADGTLGPFVPTAVKNWYILDLNSQSANLNLGGLTQIRLRFDLEDNSNLKTNSITAASGNAGSASRPQLIVEYYIP